MVSIGKLATGQGDYYLEQAQGRVDRATSVSSGVEDYYLGGPEAAGYWLGRGADRLDVRGKVAEAGLRRILAGEHPATGKPLVRRGEGTVPGFDVTFSAPKSVSVLFGIGDERLQRIIRDAHDAAVSDAFAYLDREASWGRRGRGGAFSVEGRGLVGSAFRHRTSRAGDPQLHTHVLVANVLEGVDGQRSALDARRLYAHAKTAGYLYQAALRSALTRELGVQWTPVKRGVSDVAGVPRPVLRAFSRRRAEIEAELDRAGATGAVAAQVAALTTRRRKDRNITPQELLPEWRERAARLGLDARRLRSLSGRSRSRSPTVALVERTFAVVGSATGLTRRKSHFTRRDVLQALCEALPPDRLIDVTDVEALASAFLESRRAVPLAVQEAPGGDVIRRRDGRVVASTRGEAKYSTPELLELERQLVDLALDGQHAGAGVASEGAVEIAIAARPTLSTEQATMVQRLTREGAQVAIVVGRAGTGKTFALDAAREAWMESGRLVIGAAVARRAANELERSAGIPATSLEALLADLSEPGGSGLPQNAIVVLDEAGMAPTRQLAELLGHVHRAEGKLVLVGDHRQLPELEAGGAFRGLAVRLRRIELVENRRQIADWERAALDALRHGDGAAALERYVEHGRVVLDEDAGRLRASLVADWWRAGGPDGGLMIALRRADVRDLNGRARALMAAVGALTDNAVSLPGGDFQRGDRVVLKHNDRCAGVTNGQLAVVTAVDVPTSTIQIDAGGRRLTLGPEYLLAATRAGDPTMLHGYAVTGHVAQGLTALRAFVLGSDELYREWTYTAMSRGRIDNRLYVAGRATRERDEFAPTDTSDTMADLLRALTRSDGQAMASDVGRLHLDVASDGLRRQLELVRRELSQAEQLSWHGELDKTSPLRRWWRRASSPDPEVIILARHRAAQLAAREAELLQQLRERTRHTVPSAPGPPSDGSQRETWARAWKPATDREMGR